MTSNISDNSNTGHKVDHEPKQAGIAKNATSKIRTSANDKENASKSVHPSDVSSCDIRERLIHLLALKPFSMLELNSRLKKEGISDHERRSIISILKDIASVRKNKVRLRSDIWDQVNENWHFYTEYEQNQSKRNKSFHLTPPYNSNAASSCVNENQTSTLIPSLPQQLDKFKNENHLPFKKRRIFREVATTATINSLNPESTHISCSYSNDISKHVVVGSNPVGNSPNSNPTHCAGHSTKSDSKHQVKDSTRGRNDLNKSDNDGKSKRQKQQQTQPQLDFPKKKERTQRKKRHNITEQFGEDLETPTKISNSDEGKQDKGKPTDFNLQQQTQPERDLPKKSESLTKSMSRAIRNKQRMIELFGEDSD